MHLLILQSVPAGVRGEIGKWMIEPYPGVFVGHLSARVRDLLWQKCIADPKVKGAMQIWQTNNEQHFKMRGHGIVRREIVDLEGVQLVRIPAGSQSSEIGVIKEETD
jgi:CRISPR-associated protein Cas2